MKFGKKFIERKLNKKTKKIKIMKREINNLQNWWDI